AESALAELPPSADLEGQLAAIRTEIEGKRTELAEVRGEAQALAREAELADRRLNAIGADREAWSNRRDRAVAQIATLDSRGIEAKQERASLAAKDRAVRAALEALSSAREEAARAEERVEGAKRRLTDVAHEIREMLEVEPDAVAGLAGIEPNTELPDVATVEQDLERLRRDRE